MQIRPVIDEVILVAFAPKQILKEILQVHVIGFLLEFQRTRILQVLSKGIW